MIATYIQELLATNNRVIVPNYGAFLVRATSKSKDANTLKEKLKDIYFSPFLKFNDELLEKFIIKKEGVSKEQASEKIKQFIDEVKKELDQEKPYSIKDFGQFVADKQGKVQFITIAKEEMTEKPEAEKKPAKTSAKKAPVKKEASKEKIKTEETKPAAKEEVKKDIPKEPEVKKEEPKKESKLQEFKAEKKEEAPVKKEQEEKPIYSYKKEKKPINKGLVWSIAIGLPVAAIFIWGVLNINTVKKVFNKEKAKTEKIAKKTTIKKTTKKETSDQSNKTAEAKKNTAKTTNQKADTKQVVKPVVASKKYYIIAGSFKNEKYAVSDLSLFK